MLTEMHHPLTVKKNCNKIENKTEGLREPDSEINSLAN